MEFYEGTFNPFGVVSNESLRVGGNDSFRGGGGQARSCGHSSAAAGVGGRERRKQQQRCGRSSRSSSSRRVGHVPTGRGRVFLFTTPQELGDRCVKFIKEQQSRLHIIRWCAVMLACWPKYRVSQCKRTHVMPPVWYSGQCSAVQDNVEENNGF